MKRGKRMKTTNNKILAILILFLILAIFAITGTMAWLTKTTSLSNIFTVGSFENPTTSPINPEESISIDGNIYEPNWNSDEEHKLVPDITFTKDPYIGIGAGSEDAVVYAYVENNFSNKVYFTINEGWEAVSANEGFAEGTYTSGLFKYTEGLKGNKEQDVWTNTPLFSNITTDETATIEDFTVEETKKLEIKVSSFLHQVRDGEGQPILTETIENAAKDAFGIM